MIEKYALVCLNVHILSLPISSSKTEVNAGKVAQVGDLYLFFKVRNNDVHRAHVLVDNALVLLTFEHEA